MRNLTFPSLDKVVKFDFTSATFAKKLKRTGPSFIVLQVLQKFRETEGRDPSYKSREKDYEKLLAIRDEIAPNLAPDSAFIHVFAQIAPATAIVGGELAQEIIKAVSKNEAPHLNVFLFDPDTCCGFIESIGV